MSLKNKIIKLFGGITPETEQSYLEQLSWWENRYNDLVAENESLRQTSHTVNKLFNVQEYEPIILQQEYHPYEGEEDMERYLSLFSATVGKAIVNNGLYEANSVVDFDGKPTLKIRVNILQPR